MSDPNTIEAVDQVIADRQHEPQSFMDEEEERAEYEALKAAQNAARAVFDARYRPRVSR